MGHLVSGVWGSGLAVPVLPAASDPDLDLGIRVKGFGFRVQSICCKVKG
jgi:hypothetical protein